MVEFGRVSCALVLTLAGVVGCKKQQTEATPSAKPQSVTAITSAVTLDDGGLLLVRRTFHNTRTSTDDVYTLLDPSGQELWSFERSNANRDEPLDSAARLEDRLFLSRGRSGKRELLSLDVHNGNQLWAVPFDEYRLDVATVGQALLAQSTSTLRRLSPDDGSVVWERRSPILARGGEAGVIYDTDGWWPKVKIDLATGEGTRLPSTRLRVPEAPDEFMSLGGPKTWGDVRVQTKLVFVDPAAAGDLSLGTITWEENAAHPRKYVWVAYHADDREAWRIDVDKGTGVLGYGSESMLLEQRLREGGTPFVMPLDRTAKYGSRVLDVRTGAVTAEFPSNSAATAARCGAHLIAFAGGRSYFRIDGVSGALTHAVRVDDRSTRLAGCTDRAVLEYGDDGVTALSTADLSVLWSWGDPARILPKTDLLQRNSTPPSP